MERSVYDEATAGMGCVGWRSGGFATALRERLVGRGGSRGWGCARTIHWGVGYVAQAGMPTPRVVIGFKQRCHLVSIRMGALLLFS